MIEIKCPYDLNQFILGEPIFENPFPEEECEKRKFYGDCYHCFSTAIASRDNQLKAFVTAQQKPNIKALGEDIRICQKSITDKKVLIGFNMAVALCNKHLVESEVEV